MKSLHIWSEIAFNANIGIVQPYVDHYKLLKILAISGCIVTIDAMGTHTNIAKTILEAKADYILVTTQRTVRQNWASKERP
jgi:predicted transposase YbfD/YdcC